MHVAEGRTVDTAHLVVDETAGRESFYVGMSRGRERNTAYVVTERARAADLSPDPGPRLASKTPEQPRMRRSRPHRLAVLAGVLERRAERADRHRDDAPGTGTRREPGHAGADLGGRDPRACHPPVRGTLRSLLPAETGTQYEQDPERGTLTRLLRAAELAGHDVEDVLRRAVASRDFDGARSIAAVLHGRVQRIVGTPEPVASGGYADRTPAIEDPRGGPVRPRAGRGDGRARVAAGQPGRAWTARSGRCGTSATCPRIPSSGRSGSGGPGWWPPTGKNAATPTRPKPSAPRRNAASPEQRASWHAAYIALRMPDERRELAAASDGELWARRAAYARETAWAPPYVAGELRDAHLAEDTYRADAVRAWHRADAAAERGRAGQARQEAEEYSALAQEVGAYREALTEVAEARRRWHAATELARQRALAADAELRRAPPGRRKCRRCTSADEPGRAGAETARCRPSRAARPRDRPRQRPSTAPPGRAGRAGRGTKGREDPRRTGTPSRPRHRAGRRGPHAPPGSRGRGGSRSTPRAVRQDPAPSRHTMSLERDELELEAGQ